MPETQVAEKRKKKVFVRFVDEWTPKNLRIIRERTGLTVQDPDKGIGCGTFGCVYLTDDPRWVVKVTRDKDEGPMSQRIVELRAKLAGGSGYGPSTALQGVVFFKDVFQARPIWWHREQFRPYVIVRENVKPVSTDFVRNTMQWYVDEKISTEESHPALNLAMKWARRFDKEKSNEKKLETAVTRYVRWMNIVADEFPYVGKTMLDLMDDDMVLQDVHAFNVGFTRFDWGEGFRPAKSVVIYDLGMTPVEHESRVEVLQTRSV